MASGQYPTPIGPDGEARSLKVFKGCRRVDMPPAAIRDRISSTIEGAIDIVNGDWDDRERGEPPPFLRKLAETFAERPLEYLNQLHKLGKAIPDVAVMITEPGDAGAVQSFGTIIRDGLAMAETYEMPETSRVRE